MKIEKVIVKENNGGGITYEAYDSDGNIVGVVAGIEFQSPQPDYAEEAKDLIAGGWSIYNAAQWYDVDGNSMGDMHDTEDENGRIIRDRELTADDVIDDDNSTHILCEIS
jgi:hypothetical protein